ncbi:MAG: Rpn family recombination-promoting nuclease/putative transposase [Bacilli bacterium]
MRTPKNVPAPLGSYTVPLLRHGYAELASAQYTIPAEQVFYLLMAPQSAKKVNGEQVAASWYTEVRRCQANGGLRMHELLNPTVDFVFKRIFGDEKNSDVLVNFLNSVFESAKEPLIESVEILNPFIDKEALTDKMSVLDIRARTETRTLINIEIQLLNAMDMPKRTLFYWARMYANQLEEGNKYLSLQKSVAVNILDFDVIAGGQYHNVFHVREDTTGYMLTDALEIHFLELRKLREQSVGLEQRLVRWMLFLSARTRERMEELAKEEPAMQKALTTLEWLSQDKEARQLYDDRQRALHDYVSIVEGAREEGEIKGRKEVARRMLAEGIATDTVARFTEFSVEEIEQLRHDTPH